MGKGQVNNPANYRYQKLSGGTCFFIRGFKEGTDDWKYATFSPPFFLKHITSLETCVSLEHLKTISSQDCKILFIKIDLTYGNAKTVNILRNKSQHMLHLFFWRGGGYQKGENSGQKSRTFYLFARIDKQQFLPNAHVMWLVCYDLAESFQNKINQKLFFAIVGSKVLLSKKGHKCK